MKKLSEVSEGTIDIRHVPIDSRIEILRLLRRLDIVDLPENIVPDDRIWALCNEEGKFTKRFARMVKDVYGVKLDNDIMGHIGDIAMPLRPDAEYTYDIAYNIDWHPGDFGDYGSCFWDYERSHVLDILQINGYGALRIYRNWEGIARAWVKEMGNMCVVFNAYGLRLDVMAEVLRNILDARYVIGAQADSEEGLIYINNLACACIADERLNVQYIELPVESVLCDKCGEEEYLHWQIHNGMLWCDECFNREFVVCECCYEYTEREYVYRINTKDKNVLYVHVCDSCFYRRTDLYGQCDRCGRFFMKDDLYPVANKVELLCCGCIDKDNNVRMCERCGQVWRIEGSGGIDTCSLCTHP